MNWCESCQTTLANEEVINDACWRCKDAGRTKESGAMVFKDHALCRAIVGRFEEISRLAFAGRGDAGKLDRQKPRGQYFFVWKKTGERSERVTVFTTRADTIFGATYVVLAPGILWWIN